MNDTLPIAIVGAGIAGLACAAALETAGRNVRLFDKGRRPGGRVATRRVAWPGLAAVAFDHGAQFAVARDAGFAADLAGLQARGAVAPWDAAALNGRTHWAGTPGMSALPRAMAGALRADQAMGRHVAWLRRDEAGWFLRHLPAEQARPGQVVDDGEVAGPFAAVLLALPAPQAVGLLLALGHGFAEPAAGAVMAPCWAAMAVFETAVPGADVRRPGDGVIAWAAREGSRPGRGPGPDAWVIHATPDWSRAHLEDDAASVGAALLAAFAGGPDLHVSAHRWRHALVETPLGAPCLWDGGMALGLCGDWCLGARVEQAYLSGRALAAAMLS